ncbi:hypothetical protein SUGI_0815090 [Cryptomeria japonica]|nr:hypothetical protein SUGI_0815090 [Cryptomeria japonica]
MAPKNQMAREIEELKEALEREKREKRELEVARERERRERVQLSARIEALEKEREQPRVDENNEHLDSHNEGSGHEEHREEIVDPEEKRLCEQGKEDNDTSWKNKTKLQQNSSLKEQHGCSFNSIRVGGIDCPVIEKRDVVKPLSLQMISDQNSDKRRQEEVKTQGPRQRTQNQLFDTNVFGKVNAGCSRRKITFGEYHFPY